VLWFESSFGVLNFSSAMTADSRQPTADSRQQTADSRQQHQPAPTFLGFSYFILFDSFIF
jgi:hypothetical protein